VRFPHGPWEDVFVVYTVWVCTYTYSVLAPKKTESMQSKCSCCKFEIDNQLVSVTFSFHCLCRRQLSIGIAWFSSLPQGTEISDFSLRSLFGIGQWRLWYWHTLFCVHFVSFGLETALFNHNHIKRIQTEGETKVNVP